MKFEFFFAVHVGAIEKTKPSQSLPTLTSTFLQWSPATPLSKFRRFHSLNLFFRRSLAPRDNRARVTHAAPRRRGLTGDESDHWFLHVFFHVLGRGFLCVTADFANHDDGFGLGIFIE